MILEGLATGLKNRACSTGCGAASSASRSIRCRSLSRCAISWSPNGTGYRSGGSASRMPDTSCTLRPRTRPILSSSKRQSFMDGGPLSSGTAGVPPPPPYPPPLAGEGRVGVAGRTPALPVSNHLPGPEHTMRRAMQRFKPCRSDADEFTELHPRLEVARDDVGLHHQAHVLRKREGGHLSGRAAPGADDWRQVAAAIAMHEIIAGGEAALFDDPRRVDEALRQRARPDRLGDRLERRIGGRVQVAIERGGLGFDREAAQHLAGIIPPGSRQLTKYEVAGLDLAPRRELPRHTDVRRRHRGRADEMNDVSAAMADEGALDHVAEFVLRHAGPRAGDERRHPGIAQGRADAQPRDLLLGLD